MRLAIRFVRNKHDLALAYPLPQVVGSGLDLRPCAQHRRNIFWTSLEQHIQSYFCPYMDTIRMFWNENRVPWRHLRRRTSGSRSTGHEHKPLETVSANASFIPCSLLTVQLHLAQLKDVDRGVSLDFDDPSCCSCILCRGKRCTLRFACQFCPVCAVPR